MDKETVSVKPAYHFSLQTDRNWIASIPVYCYRYILMGIDTYSVPFSLCCLWKDARCGRDLCQASCGIPWSGWPGWMLSCRSRKPYAAAPASTQSPCTPRRGPRLQLPTSCACGNPRCAGTSWPVCGLWSGW